MERYLQGMGISPGIAIAPALLFFHDRYDIPSYAVSDLEAELARLDMAMQKTRKDLEIIYERAVQELGDRNAAIFHAHMMILDDVVLREELTTHLSEHQKNMEHTLDALATRYAQAMNSVDDLRFRERTADMLDVIDRVLRHLLDAERPNLRTLDQESIIVAHDLTPSDTASMDTSKALGLIIEAGSVTSHSSILARALEIPAVIGVEDASAAVTAGTMVIVDGSSGRIILDPTRETCVRYRKAQERLIERRAALLRSTKGKPACTVDGVEVMLRANIELPLEIEHSQNVNAQGIGLYRTEYLFIDRDSLPEEEEQYKAYAHVAEAIAPHPVVLRTMDIGGDKFVAHLQILKEDNPQLGWRAVRFCLARPDIFKTQLRAMLRASVHGTIEIMFPMISGIEELRKVKEVVHEVMADLDEEKIPYNSNIKIGSMIEVPSAVMLADLLAQESDFFSIGTNDLIQYLLAVDRVNEKIAHLYEPAHPAVIRMIHQAAQAARVRNIPCSICGEMAGDALYTELLLGLGITALSMAPVAIPRIREEISHIYLGEARTLARKALKMRTAAEIKELMEKRHLIRAKKCELLMD
ncbi:MAG: phosphoenolpyruvate--protein phosphotransferase [Candidatus Hydrogenedentes bacterium]|nr:phosphoenolpyruvate--protein phosphotransferase [Candidatus Hydrogenedentota bacterium]